MQIYHYGNEVLSRCQHQNVDMTAACHQRSNAKRVAFIIMLSDAKCAVLTSPTRSHMSNTCMAKGTRENWYL